ncbi:hypothetical protein EIP91_001489 [Steccherinum ochraceum]|uniref:Uncharacterized protein n=1 Tax=Steccherinum ochraceum TaxID=92696 RepID=A0A4R0RXL7_9APHY|nr:hypothetical protein EIP91_001489 [Steccherinum ochraceum]
MLSNTVLATPRPRPPAKVRRSPSLNFPPPPPYAPRLEILLDSPIGVTAQLLGSAVGDEESDAPTQVVEDWMNEKSKGELSDLLLKADGLIKERETELGLTSALVKSLYHDNIALKTKHEALLSRLPSNPNRTPSPPVIPVAVLVCPSPTAQSPHYYSASLPHTPVDSPARQSPPLPHLRHLRKVSVSPTEIALLADQNAELLDKLEQLEEESDRNDQVSRRKLKKLEKEIQGLRDELEQTQAKEHEAAEKARVLSEAELQRRKDEREERLRGMKEQAFLDSELVNDVRDFAPAPELPRSGTVTSLAEEASPPIPPPVNMATKPTLDDSLSKSSLCPPLSRSPSSPPEYALIAQLLEKIKELEDTNSQIKTTQQDTAERYHAAQRDAENIRRVFDYLEIDVADTRLGEDASSSLPPSGSVEETIKYSSLRRNMDGEFEPRMDDDLEEDFVSGISADMRSTTRNVLPPPGNKSANGHKARKSVVGLFDAPRTSQPSTSDPRALYPASLDVSPSFRSVDPLSNDLADMSAWSTAAVDSSFEAESPAVSTLGLSLPPNVSAFGSISQPKHTLGSELGSEFGDDWGQNAGNYHLRASSLYDLTHITAASRENTPSPTAEQPALFHTPPGSPPATESVWEDVDDSPDLLASSVSGSATPMRKRMSLVVDPPSPSPSKSNRNSVALREARSLRNIRLSETVRSRTNRWVEGRYAESTLTVPIRRRRSTRASTHGHASRGSDASAVFSETFDVVVRQLSFSGGDPAEEDEDTITGKELVRVANTSTAVALPPRKPGFVGFILEVWLWLQFAIVVMVFLWAMARRGPKSVLRDAENRKASGTVRR